MPYALYHRKEKERERTIKRRKYFREYHREDSRKYLELSPEEIIERRKEFGKSREGEKNPMFGRTGEKSPYFGKHRSQETRDKMSKSLAREKNPNWKDGRTPLRRRIRNSFKYRQWRSDIFTRDDFTCQECSHRGGKLHCHHIKSFALILELNDVKSLKQALECSELWDINNGITYCKKCHLKMKGGE